ncbi:TetR/AcrR family transcriptional regulator [Ancylobacter sp. SL191]|uniref:TetR/AcrR family transcriptional regulator n=1 Tax=Ancylobacter sp. SL191 TaxID=2995166 RepID=UPI00227035B3|nr:TetR/AcrR family transcriptional regulator [Ancylobacter sp. SL191]WAC28460.1 helix-turn-helix domain containing protein [Ancylobacter sp. SL191]
MAIQKRPKLSRAEQKARRPGEILEAAFDEFAEKGFAATRVEDVAARIGVTKGTVYVYFPTKEILFEEAFRHVAAVFADLRREIERLDGGYADRLQNVLRLGYRKLADDRRVRDLLRLSLAEGIRFPEMVLRHHDEFIAPLVTAIRTVVEDGVRAGELEGAAVATMPDVIGSSILHLSLWRSLFMDQRPLDEAAFIEAHLELVRRALRPVAGAA